MIDSEKLIRYGYFPHWIIPPFKSELLADALPKIKKANLKTNLLRKNKNNEIIGKFKSSSKCFTHSVPKIKKIRRTICIPNPLHQIILCDTIEKKWDKLKPFLEKSKISITGKNISSNTSERLKPVFDNHEISVQHALRSSDSRFVLRTDVSRFYPTIYTHIIPWVIHTKEKAKLNHSPRLLGNDLDTCVRNCQDQQTLGIPTGPYSSHIIAEIIASNIDNLLLTELEKNKIHVRGYRYIDDYSLFFQTYSDAEFCLSKFSNILRKFELEINSYKTKIAELPEPLESSWASDFRYFKFKKMDESGKPIANSFEIISLFNKAFEFTKKFPNENVLKYCLKIIEDIDVNSEDWPLLEALILESIIAEPTCLPVAIKILFKTKINAESNQFEINYQKISETISEMIRYHNEYNHGYEIAWSLWLAKTLDIVLPPEVSLILSQCEDSIVALVSLDLNENDLLQGGLDYTKWKTLLNSRELYSENWLFCYEVNIKEWIPFEDDYVGIDPFFSILKENNVVFYDRSVSFIDQIRDVDFGIFDYQQI
jgi:hypothetical protein